MKIVNFNISGMTCASCAATNEKALKNLPGVESASVNFATHIATVSFDEKMTDEMSLHKAVVENGYKVLIHESHDEHTHHAASKKDLAQVKVRAVSSLVLATIVAVLAMLSGNFKEPFSVNLVWGLQGILSSFVILYLGRSFHAGMAKQALRFRANMDTLVSLGTLTALAFSWYSLAMMRMEIYFETGAVITALILLGEYFEMKSAGQASEAIEKLLKLGAKTARLIDRGQEKEIPIESVKIGDLLLVKPGEKIPVDGVIIKGRTNIDESMMTGESLPVFRKEGEEIFGATINIDGAIEMKALKVGEGTLLSQIIKMVSDAQTKKAPIQKIADTISGYFVPVILLIALITLIAWYLATGNLADSLASAVAVLIIACPCALGLATPTAIMVGTGIGARKGILIKDGESLEKGKHIDVVIFDKTGTLTEGKPAVTDIISCSVKSQTEILGLMASLEKLSEHPLARAVVNHAQSLNITFKDVSDFSNLSGKGIRGRIEGADFFIGTTRLMAELGIKIDHCRLHIEKLENEAKTAVIFADTKEGLGVLGIADTLKVDALEAISKLKGRGIEPVMMTGDNKKTAQVIASRLGIKNVLAEVLPQDKASRVKEFQSSGKKVAFVGDGINDAPALAQADLGIAIGTGTDIAIEAGNIVLVKGSPMKAVEALELSKLTFRTIKQNLFWAFFYNAAAVPLAAFGFLNPMIAAAAMGFSSVSVVGNSLRIKNKKL